MKLLLHAITPRADRRTPIQIEGVRNYRLISVDVDDLTAWASELPDEVDAFTRADMLAHHRVVSAIDSSVEGCLPARFPTSVTDVGGLRAQLQSRRRELNDQLARVSGCCELAVTALWTTPEQPAIAVDADTPGRRYLLQRQVALTGAERRQARARGLADELERLAGPDVVDVHHQVCPSANVAVASALLVRRTLAADVQARLRRTQPDVRILVNGPWPPYTFAGVRSD